MTIIVNLLTRDKIVGQMPLEITDWAQRNGELPKVIERPIYEGKYWSGELVLRDEPTMIRGKRRYELIERGDEIWYAEVGDV